MPLGQLLQTNKQIPNHRPHHNNTPLCDFSHPFFLVFFWLSDPNHTEGSTPEEISEVLHVLRLHCQLVFYLTGLKPGLSVGQTLGEGAGWHWSAPEFRLGCAQVKVSAYSLGFLMVALEWDVSHGPPQSASHLDMIFPHPNPCSGLSGIPCTGQPWQSLWASVSRSHAKITHSYMDTSTCTDRSSTDLLLKHAFG